MKYQNSQPNNKTQCTICPRNCVLAEGQRGFCFVRKNVNGKITLTAYGYNTGLAIDPVEKKPLYHFYPGTKVLSFGTTGCNLSCAFCQNWQSSRGKIDPTLLNKTSPEEIAILAEENGCKSVAFTYNEPTIFFEYAVDTAKECRKRDIKTIAVTAGYINPEPRKEFYKYMDAANVDLKSFNPNFYKKYCLIDLEPVLDTIKYIKHETNCWLELTTLLIEGENDSSEEIEEECNWIKENIGIDTPIHFSAFHPSYKFMDRKATSFPTLQKAYEIATKVGLRYVYTGNIIETITSSTYCHNCGRNIIKRSGNCVEDYNVDKHGNCRYCGTKAAGYF